MAMHYSGGWGNLKFPKRGSDIVTKAEAKIKELQKKISERGERVKKICSEKGLDVAALLSNVDQFQQYNTSNGHFGMTVGQMAELRSEAQAIQSEKHTLGELELIARNLPKEQNYELNFQQMEFLDF